MIIYSLRYTRNIKSINLLNFKIHLLIKNRKCQIVSKEFREISLFIKLKIGVIAEILIKQFIIENV
jgi:hypothetical protein